jgi:hypothetical protein
MKLPNSLSPTAISGTFGDSSTAEHRAQQRARDAAVGSIQQCRQWTITCGFP